MEKNSLSPADIAALSGNNDSFGNNGAWWLILFMMFAFGGNGWGNGWGNNGWNNLNNDIDTEKSYYYDDIDTEKTYYYDDTDINLLGINLVVSLSESTYQNTDLIIMLTATNTNIQDTSFCF